MVPSRGTCTLLASYRGRGPGAPGAGSCRAEGCRRGRTGYVCVNLPQVRCHTDPPGEPGTRPRSAGSCSTAPGCCHPPRPRANPATPVHSGILAFLSVAAVWTWAGKRPRPTPPPCPSSPQRRAGPREPDRRTAASAAKETFSPEQPGSSTLRQLSLQAPSLLFSKQAPRRSRDARLLGDWARVPHMEAPLLEPLGLECLAALTQPRLAASSVGSALPGPPSHFSCGQFLSRAHSNSIARVSCSSCKLAMHRAYL